MLHLLVDLELLAQEALHHRRHPSVATTQHLFGILGVHLLLLVELVQEIDGQDLHEVGVCGEVAAYADGVNVLEKHNVVHGEALFVNGLELGAQKSRQYLYIAIRLLDVFERLSDLSFDAFPSFNLVLVCCLRFTSNTSIVNNVP